MKHKTWPRKSLDAAAGLVITLCVLERATAQAPSAPVSVEFPHDDEPLFFAPLLSVEAAKTARRGSAQLGARLPLYGTATATGPCPSRWLLVGPEAWVCEDRVTLGPLVAVGANQHTLFDDGLPFAYHYVNSDGAFGYENLEHAEEGSPASQLEPDFAVGIVRTQLKPGGELYGLTTHELWIPMRDLRPARSFDFQGVTLGPGAPLPAWVVEEDVAFQDRPGTRVPSAKRVLAPRFTRFEVLERRVYRDTNYVRVGKSQWLPARVLREATVATTPSDLKPQERWISVDTETQTLVAYEGMQAVFATLVSTGRGSGSSELATPKGEFRVWVKLLSTDMTNLEDPSASRYYAIESVPYVMFFSGGYGLHGAFWHRSFGHKRSHGCVNLAPLDAQFIFYWAGPRLPAGWRAALPTRYDLGTRVVVR